MLYNLIDTYKKEYFSNKFILIDYKIVTRFTK